MIKYAVTGHTHGIGKQLFERVSPNVIGFSRSTGYNITEKECRKHIITLSQECDVFVNNAYDEFGQVLMLYELYDSWKDSNKIIVNIGSETTCGIKKHPHKYTAHKAALDKASEQLSHLNSNCKVINVRFGWVGTERILTNYSPASYIEVDDAVSYILEQIKWSSKYRVTESLLRPL